VNCGNDKALVIEPDIATNPRTESASKFGNAEALIVNL
jgi:hypothetical protein